MNHEPNRKGYCIQCGFQIELGTIGRCRKPKSYVSPKHIRVHKPGTEFKKIAEGLGFSSCFQCSSLEKRMNAITKHQGRLFIF